MADGAYLWPLYIVALLGLLQFKILDPVIFTNLQKVLEPPVFLQQNVSIILRLPPGCDMKFFARRSLVVFSLGK